MGIVILLPAVAAGAWSTEASAPKTKKVKLEFSHYHLLLLDGQRIIKVELDRAGTQVFGSARLDQRGGEWLRLSGTLSDDVGTLKVEHTVENGTDGLESAAAGTWKIDFANLSKPGIWIKGESTFPLLLRLDPEYPVMRFRLVLTAHMTVARAALGLFPKDNCHDIATRDRTVSYDRIDVFSGPKHVQALNFYVESDCDIVVPRTEDADFDGYPDILIDKGGNYYGRHYLLWWRFSPTQRRFIRDRAIDTAQDEHGPIQELKFYPSDKTVRQYWESTGAPNVGEVAWRWQAGKLVKSWVRDCNDREEFDSGGCVRKPVPFAR